MLGTHGCLQEEPGRRQCGNDGHDMNMNNRIEIFFTTIKGSGNTCSVLPSSVLRIDQRQLIDLIARLPHETRNGKASIGSVSSAATSPCT